eukprot:GHVN01088100.1.p1 GENE.GHVN01088100.1~~GHVN01088100.1.p1  ORF type:complete len:132 (-),score=13.46 GHVN01088100.1:31-426(-)
MCWMQEPSVDLTRLEEEDGNLSEVEVDEVFRFVGDIAAEVAAYDAMPSGVVLFVELLLDVGSDVLLDVVLLESLGGAVDGILLHIFRHISVLDHGLTVSHDGLFDVFSLQLIMKQPSFVAESDTIFFVLAG